MELVAPLEIGIVVRDLETMTEFYRDVIGFEYVCINDVPSDKADVATMWPTGYRIVRLQTNRGERIKLVQPNCADLPKGPASNRPVLGRPGPAFLTFIVEDLGRAMEQLANMGARLSTPQPVEIRDGVYLAFVLDPEDNQLELVMYRDLKEYRSDLA
jgi:catechol 2,3-dioxygenase-like lactoylglutathione lyase family enzyme